ncbi:MAG: hypothetical protein AAGJ39_12370 [Pseudomonadota bacterium]
MSFHPQQMVRLCWQGLMSPREGANAALSLGVPAGAIWPMAGLVSVALAYLRYLQFQVIGPVNMELPDGTVETVQIEPLPLAGMLLGTIAIGSWALTYLGSRMGGTGRFEEAATLLVYLNMIAVGLNVAILAAMIVMPGLWLVLGFAAFTMLIWLSVQFTDVLHGFGSLMKAAGLLLAVVTAVAIGMMFLITLFGGLAGA